MGSPSTRKRGSKAFWPRVRSKNIRSKVNSWKSNVKQKEANLLGFAGYKVGMTHIGVIDNFSHTLTKGTEIIIPVTIIECPEIKVLSIRLLASDKKEHLQCVKEIPTTIKDKFIQRKLSPQKKKSKLPAQKELLKFLEEQSIKQIKLKVITSPSNTTIGKKKPEVLELGVSGSLEEQLKFSLEKLGSTIKLSDVFKGGELIDTHSVTKGKGFQGAVKRFGVKLTAHKSEKKRRHAGNLGAWTPSRVMHTVPLPGQTGFHRRCEWNKWILKVSKNQDEINKKCGFRHYGIIKNEYLLVKGSVGGTPKRLITMVRGIRVNPRYPKIAPEITFIHK